MNHLFVYILHAKNLEIRKNMCHDLEKKLKESVHFADYRVEFVYIESHDPVDIDLTSIQQYVDLKPTGIAAFDQLIKGLHIRQFSNALKHVDAWTHIADEKTRAHISAHDNVMYLVLEDDVVFADSVDEKLHAILDKMYLKDKSTPWDINFLGFPQIVKDEEEAKQLQHENVRVAPVESLFRLLPEVSSYLVKDSIVAKRVKEAFFPCRFPTHIQISFLWYILKDLKLTMTTPNIFVDGTKFGVYLSSIEANNKLFLNNDYNQIHSLVSKGGENVQEIRDKMEKIKFNNHPDFQTLNAIFEMKNGNYEKAKELFAYCHKMYVENNCVLNSESTFLIDYARVFRHFQEV